MKEYVKPTLEKIELRVEERIARCKDDPIPGDPVPSPVPGNHPGNQMQCPAGS